MTNELTVKSEDFGITEKDAQELTKGLETIKLERDVLIDQFNEVSKLEITEENIKKFRSLRLSIRDNRTKGLVQWHKTNKEYFLAGGRFVDAIKNKEILVNEQMESILMDAEKHFENLEKERIATLQKKRAEQIQEYLPDAFDVTLTDMEDDVWEAFFETKKRKHLEAIEEEKKAEAERQAKIKAEEEERERQRLENERLKAEIEENERIAAEEEAKRAKIEAERIAKEQEEIKKREAKEKAEREAYELKLKQEREQREKAEAEAKAKQEALEAELQAKKDAEAKAEAERIAKEQEAKEEADKIAKAPIKEQLNNWVDGFVIGVPLGLNENQKALEILLKFESFKKWAKSEIKSM